MRSRALSYQLDPNGCDHQENHLGGGDPVRGVVYVEGVGVAGSVGILIMSDRPHVTRVECSDIPKLRSLFPESQVRLASEPRALFDVPVLCVDEVPSNTARIVLSNGTYRDVVLEDIIIEGIQRSPLERITSVFQENW